MNRFTSIDIFLLILCTIKICSGLQCFDCQNESNDAGEINNDCGNCTDYFPTVTCDEEGDKAKCVFVQVINSTTNYNSVTRTCVKQAGDYCHKIYPLPGFNIVNCYVCDDDLCNKLSTATPPAVLPATKARYTKIKGLAYLP